VTFLRRRGWDVLVLIMVTLVLLEVLSSDQDVPLALSVPVGLAMTLPLLWAQRWTAQVACVVMGAWVLQSMLGDWSLEPQTELLPVGAVFWSVGAYLPRRRSWTMLAVVLAALVAHEPSDSIVMVPLMAGVFGAGRLMRSREGLARALEQERSLAEKYAVAEERVRIARELHDVVGHAVSLMTVQAGAERLALGDERPQTSEVLSQIEVTGRQAMQEMRRLVGVLRTDEEPVVTPQPGLDQLEPLVERFRRSGLDVDLTVEQQPGGKTVPLSAGADISAYRIVQEGLTNVLKHADAREARVRVRHTPDEVAIEVTDHGTGGASEGSSGHGLLGMNERVALFGGSLEVGPGSDGGWQLVAVLPREAAP
jgi:signal transduction histidine kinase